MLRSALRAFQSALRGSHDAAFRAIPAKTNRHPKLIPEPFCANTEMIEVCFALHHCCGTIATISGKGTFRRMDTGFQ